MMQRAIALLTRLEKQELDRECSALRAVEAELAACREELDDLARRFAAEYQAGWELPDGLRLLAAYARGTRRRQEELRAKLAQLEAARQAAAETVRERIGSYKSLELVGQGLEAQASAAAARRASARTSTTSTPMS